MPIYLVSEIEIKLSMFVSSEFGWEIIMRHTKKFKNYLKKVMFYYAKSLVTRTGVHYKKITAPA